MCAMDRILVLAGEFSTHTNISISNFKLMCNRQCFQSF